MDLIGGHGLDIGTAALLIAAGVTLTFIALCMVFGGFFAERRVDELFLTLAPQVAGRDGASERPGLAAGWRFLPDDPRWGRLVSVKRGGSHLFLRYALGGERP